MEDSEPFENVSDEFEDEASWQDDLPASDNHGRRPMECNSSQNHSSSSSNANVSIPLLQKSASLDVKDSGQNAAAPKLQRSASDALRDSAAQRRRPAIKQAMKQSFSADVHAQVRKIVFGHWLCPDCECENSGSDKCAACGVHRKQIFACSKCTTTHKIKPDKCSVCHELFGWDCEFCGVCNYPTHTHCMRCNTKASWGRVQLAAKSALDQWVCIHCTTPNAYGKAGPDVRCSMCGHGTVTEVLSAISDQERIEHERRETAKLRRVQMEEQAALRRAQLMPVQRVQHWQAPRVEESRYRPGTENMTPLIAAAGQGDLDLVRVLLDQRADINERTFTSETALSFAAALGHDYLVDFLLSRGADARVLDYQGNSALNKACWGGSSAVVEHLSSAIKHKSLLPTPPNRRLAFLMALHPCVSNRRLWESQNAKRERAEEIAHAQQRESLARSIVIAHSQPAAKPTTPESIAGSFQSGFSGLVGLFLGRPSPSPAPSSKPSVMESQPVVSRWSSVEAKESGRSKCSAVNGASQKPQPQSAAAKPVAAVPMEDDPLPNDAHAPAASLLFTLPPDQRARSLQIIFQLVGQFG